MDVVMPRLRAEGSVVVAHRAVDTSGHLHPLSLLPALVWAGSRVETHVPARRCRRLAGGRVPNKTTAGSLGVGGLLCGGRSGSRVAATGRGVGARHVVVDGLATVGVRACRKARPVHGRVTGRPVERWVAVRVSVDVPRLGSAGGTTLWAPGGAGSSGGRPRGTRGPGLFLLLLVVVVVVMVVVVVVMVSLLLLLL